MTATEILAALSEQNIEVWVEGERLRFRAPAGALTPALRAILTEKKEEVLHLLRRQGCTSRAYPLSYSQRAMWFLHQTGPESVAYNVAFAARIRSAVDVPALRWAFQCLVDRHAALRTTYSMVNGAPVQRVHSSAELCFEEIDAAAWMPEEFHPRVVQAYRRAFDLERGPLLRVSLFSHTAQDHILLLTVHHIAVDGWSLFLLLNELRTLYAGGQTGLPVIKLAYTDYVRWQSEMLSGGEGECLWAYWQKQLAGRLPVLNLPTDRPRPSFQTYNGASHSFVLEKELTRRLEALACAEGSTLYMLLLAVFHVLLYRYTGQEYLLVGSPTNGRSQPEFASVVGDFVNMIVLRANPTGLTFKAFLAAVRGTVLSAIEHQDYPLALLVARLQPVRDPSRSPLFQALFALQKFGRSKAALADFMAASHSETQFDFAGLKLEPFVMAQQEGQFDLGLEMAEGSGLLVGTFKYNSDLFNAATIVRMTGHLQTLLEGIVANPEQRISELRMMTTTERHQLLVDWNNTKREYSAGATYPKLFEAQAELTPNAVAIVFEERQLTYGELNARANQLAHHLRKLGVVADTLVGVFVERSIEMVVALLGILKAGGAYMPLDPTYPSERLAFMVEDARLSIIVTQPELIDNLPSHQAQFVCLTSDWNQFSGDSEENPTPNTDATNLAYVIYTSGSTGKPKGVQIPRSALANFLQSMRERPGITSQDILLAVTTLSFDIAGLELHLPLSVGARVVLTLRENATDGRKLAEEIKKSGATIMQATPATWRLLLESGWQGNKQLKILCGGEALPRELANQLIEKSASLWNMYGPTETTIWSTVYQVGSTEGPVLVGRPIANTRIYILDRYREPTPIGVPGELCIGGAGVARGYLNRAELTEEKFIADHFSQEAVARIYRTGDLARYLVDGNIELLGRIDHQVKVRGFRIELGEIEAVLREHAALRDAVVLAREDVPGDKRLVGYVVADKGTPPTTGELRSFLQQKLPDYMVPGVFVFLEALPLTPNQKVDRRALPTPDTARPELESVFVAPESGVEKTLAEIWRAVLGVERVGIHDNFFDLGGHSLLLAKVHSKLQAALGRELAMIELFRYSTISALAKYLSNAAGKDSLKESGDRAERQRSAMLQQQIRMQTIAERRTATRRG